MGHEDAGPRAAAALNLSRQYITPLALTLPDPRPSPVCSPNPNQALYGVKASEAARVWAGEVNDTASAYSTMGYYWHAPVDFDSNRGLGCSTPTAQALSASVCTPYDAPRDAALLHDLARAPYPQCASVWLC